MTLTDVKNFYGSLDNAAKAINVGSGILGFTEHLAPMVQMVNGEIIAAICSVVK